MFDLFKKDRVFKIITPITGKVIDIVQTPDPVFSEKMVGDGVAIEPTEGLVVSPIDGEVVQLFPTNHAIGLKNKEGLEILIHIGIDTVKMKGKGFQPFINKGDKVKTGQKLMIFDLDLIKKEARSIITPVVTTNIGQAEVLKKTVGDVFSGNDEIMQIRLKK